MTVAGNNLIQLRFIDYKVYLVYNLTAYIYKTFY